MTTSAPRLPDPDLMALDAAIDRALVTGDESGLDILGYGEVSCVVSWRAGERALACKRLPLFDDADTWGRYRSAFHDYLDALAARGVTPLPAALQSLGRADQRVSVYCVQPRLAGARVLSRHLREVSPERALELFDRVCQHVLAAVGPRLGLDGQLSNWVLDDDGALAYLDVTTPMLRGDDGRERLPLGLFLASLPWALRGVVRRFMLQGILDKYYQPRGVILDLLGNLYKERLDALLPAFLARAAELVEPAITEAEARRYYKDDASTWALLQRLRRLDRAWQRGVRRRPYPFLLPGAIER